MGEEIVDLLQDVLNQACGMENGNLCTWALSSYEEGLTFMVDIGKAEWVKKDYIARWKHG